MRTIKIVVLSLALFLAWGCIDSRLRDCPPKAVPNTTIYFSYKDAQDKEQFITKIHSVELFIYDKEGKKIERHTIAKEALEQFVGAKLYLKPGHYDVIAWGNVSDELTHIFTDQTIPYPEREENYLLTAVEKEGRVGSGDPLYYAPSRNAPLLLSVPKEGEVEVTANFKHAHVMLDISVVGYELEQSKSALEPLQIEVTNLTSRYCFRCIPHGEIVSYRGSGAYLGSGPTLYNGYFNVPRFEESTPTEIILKNSRGEQISPPISLRKIVEGNIDLEKVYYIPIKVLFEKKGEGYSVVVIIEMPGWGDHIVIPIT